MTTPQPETTILPAGTVLDDRFEICQFLGAGSFGAVYRAKQIILGHPIREVALKLFKAGKITAANARDVFADALTLVGMTEAESCPPEVGQHIIQVYDVGFVQKSVPQAYLTMRLVPGGKTLQSAIRRWKNAGGMDVQTSLRFLRELLVPLAWMHLLDPPAVHGDLKPDNVLMTDDAKLILTDFGLAGRLPLGTVGGAIQYQAPETLLGNIGLADSDVFGIGLIWYEMLTGVNPFQDASMEAAAADRQNALVYAQIESRKLPMRPRDPSVPEDRDRRIVPASEVNPEFAEHPQLEAMLRRCLAFRRSERYPNARLLLNDIERYLATGVAGGIAAADPPQAPEPVLPKKDRSGELADADALLQKGMADQAIRRAIGLQQKYPDWIPVLLLLARAELKRGNTASSREWSTRAQRISRDDPAVLEVMSLALEAEGQSTAALALRTRAQQLRAKHRGKG